MIQLHSGALVFETSGGDAIPCSAELVTVELIGPGAGLLDPHLLRQATSAVLHYFKVELGLTQVSLGEFSQALAKVLRGFGVDIQESKPAAEPRQVEETDLRQLACDSGKGFELAFFSRLRAELRDKLARSPDVLRFNGLRGCVKQLAGAQRWSNRCQELNDQIVEYLRGCLNAGSAPDSCALVVR